MRPNGHTKLTADKLFKRLARDLTKQRSPLPGKAAFAKEVTRIKKLISDQPPSDLDTPWHLGLMINPKYAIPPEVVPDILALQDWALKQSQAPDVADLFRDPLSIREALWVARLHGMTRLYRNTNADPKNKKFDINLWLWQWSKIYAEYEKLCCLAKTPFDTTALDRGLWSGAMPAWSKNAIGLLQLQPDGKVAAVWEEKKKESEQK